MILSEGNIRLRAIEPHDADVLHMLLTLPELGETVVGWSGPVSIHSQLSWIEQIKPTDFRYAVEVDNEVCGVTHISPIDFKNRSANINIKFLPKYQKQGLGGRTVKLLLRFLFLELDMAVVSAGILETNSPSKRLFERAGFKLDGILRNRIFRGGKRLSVFQYSLTREEFLDESQ